MKNLYKFLNVNEKASKDEILTAYNNIMKNEIEDAKKNQLRIAAEILLDDEKRKKYDSDLNKSRAEQLLKQVKIEEKVEENVKDAVTENQIKDKESNNEYNKKIKEAIMQEAQKQLNEKKMQEEKEAEERKLQEEKNAREKMLQEEKRAQELKFKKIEEEEYQKALKKQEKLKKKQIKKAEQEYKDAYAEAYHAELKKMGYNVKAPWTKRRIKNLIISVIVIILILFIVFKLPIVRNFFKELYYSNEIIKTVCDVFLSILGGVEKTVEQM